MELSDKMALLDRADPIDEQAATAIEVRLAAIRELAAMALPVGPVDEMAIESMDKPASL